MVVSGAAANTATVRCSLANIYFHLYSSSVLSSHREISRSSYTDSLKTNNEEELEVVGGGVGGLRGRKKVSLPLNNIDINKEKRTQKFLLLILISHFICILPINILK